jgi:dTDP-4-dehydrorhamnose reductase
VRVLVIGGAGQLGTEIQRRWTGDEIVAPSRAELDIESAPALAEALERVAPEAVVNCAAFHNVDRCEETPERAFEVNALAVDRLARLCRDRDAIFVTISTDYVFDGSATRPYAEDDPARPISAYGTSKLAGELLVGRLQSRAFVVRTCGVYGIRTSTGKGHTFVDRILAQARAGETSRVVSDVIASPTFAGDLARALRELLATRAYGLYHAVNPGPVSWYDFAREALAQAGVRGQIEPISAQDWTAPARRPAFSALDDAKIGALGIGLPSWHEGIAAYLNLRAGDAGA